MDMTDEEFRVLMLEVFSQESVDVFVDTNILLVGAERKLWAGDPKHVLVTREIISEVRKRTCNLGANKFVDACLDSKRVLSRDGCPFKHALDFVTACAMKLPPTVQTGICEYVNACGDPVDTVGRSRMLNKVLQQVVNQDPSLFATPAHREELIRRGILPEVNLSVSTSLKRSWFSYLQKRMKKKSEGQYLATDERIAAMATINSVLAGRPSVIISSDYDFAAIFKQLIDNVLSVASMDADGNVNRSAFNSLVHAIEALGMKRELRQIDNFLRKGDAACALAPLEGEVLLIVPRVRESMHFVFGDGFKQFLLNIDEKLAVETESAKKFEVAFQSKVRT